MQRAMARPLALLLAALAASPARGRGGPCALAKCGAELGRCAREPACRGINACVLGCLGDLGCAYACGTEADSPANIALVSCLQRGGCLPRANDTKTPDDFTARLGNLTTPPFDRRALSGRWWVNYGLNTALDCVPCQSFSFSADPSNSSTFAVHQKFRSMRRRIWNYVNFTSLCTAEDAARGRLHDVYTQAGFGGRDDWYILGMSGNEMLAAYVANSQWQTHGVFLMAREPQRVVASVGRWRAILEQNGIHWGHLCQADVTSADCLNHVKDVIVV